MEASEVQWDHVSLSASLCSVSFISFPAQLRADPVKCLETRKDILGTPPVPSRGCLEPNPGLLFSLREAIHFDHGNQARQRRVRETLVGLTLSRLS